MHLISWRLCKYVAKQDIKVQYSKSIWNHLNIIVFVFSSCVCIFFHLPNVYCFLHWIYMQIFNGKQISIRAGSQIYIIKMITLFACAWSDGSLCASCTLTVIGLINHLLRSPSLDTSRCNLNQVLWKCFSNYQSVIRKLFFPAVFKLWRCVFCSSQPPWCINMSTSHPRLRSDPHIWEWWSTNMEI